MFGFFKRQLRRVGYNIRKINFSEIQDLQALAIDTFIETYPDYIAQKGGIQNVREEINSLYSYDNLSDWLLNPCSICLGLFQLKPVPKLTGFSLLQVNEDQAFLSKIYLLKSTQGQGLGRILLEANFSELRNKKTISQLKLEVWDKNTRAKSFYEKMGFNHNGVLHLYPGSADCPMYDEEYIKSKNTVIEVCASSMHL